MKRTRIVTGFWNKEIDHILCASVSIYGTKNWIKIANIINKTNYNLNPITPQECQDRWNYLSNENTKEAWNDEEELEMIIAHKKHKNKWSSVAHELNGKNNNAVKNRFYSIFRKIKNKIKKKDFVYESKLELLEAFYILSIIKSYLEHPIPIKEQNGKRKKDFIYSLLDGLEYENIKEYSTELLNRGNKEPALEEVQLEIKKKNLIISSIETNIRQKSLAKIGFHYVSGISVYERVSYKLPPIPNSDPITTLTNEEKRFIQTHFFRNSEPLSYSTLICSPMLTNSAIQSLISTTPENLHPIAMTHTKKESSDYANMRNISLCAYQNEEHKIHSNSVLGLEL